MNLVIKPDEKGVTIEITPITSPLAEQLLICLEGCKFSSAFGVDTYAVNLAPGHEFGCLSLNFNNSVTLTLEMLQKLVSLFAPLSVTGSENFRISE
ncbi:hypothetical protein [Enterobacter hormaechei]|uniref:hypothetical protein n=1 Tax=Enterobacter hormaechei TaxID=158836 RepID=UPI002A747842|nr:hypothetical protein [Enterobacter hormaechei]MDY3570244.1 hypothetical protein [Enterobacter hormaechei]